MLSRYPFLQQSLNIQYLYLQMLLRLGLSTQQKILLDLIVASLERCNSILLRLNRGVLK